MQISIISGSHRKPSQSRKVAGAIERMLLAMGVCERTWLLDLGDGPLPLWEEAIWSDDPVWRERLAPLRAELMRSEALVIVSPEWGGMAPAGLKNFFLMWGKQGEVAHKPALLVGVSSEDGGAYSLAELRMSSYKNNRICYIPEQLIVRRVESVLNEDPGENDAERDAALRARMGYALTILGEYSRALVAVRASGACDLSVYGGGM